MSAGTSPNPSAIHRGLDGASDSIKRVTDEAYDLRYDSNEVGGDLVVECWISHGLWSEAPDFDPQSSDLVTLGDEEEPPVRGRVVRREGNRVWVQIELPSDAHPVA